MTKLRRPVYDSRAFRLVHSFYLPLDRLDRSNSRGAFLSAIAAERFETGCAYPIAIARLAKRIRSAR
jgi:hypothetical protein